MALAAAQLLVFIIIIAIMCKKVKRMDRQLQSVRGQVFRNGVSPLPSRIRVNNDPSGATQNGNLLPNGRVVRTDSQGNPRYLEILPDSPASSKRTLPYEGLTGQRSSDTRSYQDLNGHTLYADIGPLEGETTATPEGVEVNVETNSVNTAQA